MLMVVMLDPGDGIGLDAMPSPLLTAHSLLLVVSWRPPRAAWPSELRATTPLRAVPLPANPS